MSYSEYVTVINEFESSGILDDPELSMLHVHHAVKWYDEAIEVIRKDS